MAAPIRIALMIPVISSSCAARIEMNLSIVPVMALLSSLMPLKAATMALRSSARSPLPKADGEVLVGWSGGGFLFLVVVLGDMCARSPTPLLGEALPGLGRRNPAVLVDACWLEPRGSTALGGGPGRTRLVAEGLNPLW